VAVAATLEAFDGCCLLRPGDRLVSSLAAGDPLHAALGTASSLASLVCESKVVDATTSPDGIVATIAAGRSTIWVARPDQVAGAATAAGAARVAAHLAAVVMPIGGQGELTAAREAADRFRAETGVEPVVAFAPHEAGGLVAMNTPPARAGSAHEVTCKPDSVGRVVSGVVVWPEAVMRTRLGLDPVAGQDLATDSPRTVAIGATLPWLSGFDRTTPRTVALADDFGVDDDGFLVAR